MSTDLTAWLLEQITEDERVARAAKDNTAGEWAWRAQDAPVVLYDYSGKRTMGEGAHIAAWDPARVLAECDAKRRIIEVHHAREATGFDRDGEEHSAMVCDACSMEDDPCPTARLLALPYADRPGYREEWRP